VRLLFDPNLSRHLLRQLAVEYPDSRHVTDVGLDTATDAEIWAWAGGNDYVIVSKDSDFRQLAFLHGPPPKAVWLRMGTHRRSTSRTSCEITSTTSHGSQPPRMKHCSYYPTT
jgi:predicted nuclease of predicted toxin-antitoxin system